MSGREDNLKLLGYCEISKDAELLASEEIQELSKELMGSGKMKAKEFAYWLAGYFENADDNKTLTRAQCYIIRRKIATVDTGAVGIEKITEKKSTDFLTHAHNIVSYILDCYISYEHCEKIVSHEVSKLKKFLNKVFASGLEEPEHKEDTSLQEAYHKKRSYRSEWQQIVEDHEMRKYEDEIRSGNIIDDHYRYRFRRRSEGSFRIEQ